MVITVAEVTGLEISSCSPHYKAQQTPPWPLHKAGQKGGREGVGREEKEGRRREGEREGKEGRGRKGKEGRRVKKDKEREGKEIATEEFAGSRRGQKMVSDPLESRFQASTRNRTGVLCKL